MISRKLGLLFYHNLASHPMTKFKFREPNLVSVDMKLDQPWGTPVALRHGSLLRPTGVRTELMQAKGPCKGHCQCHAKTSRLAKISL